MDRRQKKTRNAIFDAFRRLLDGKRYDQITVQEIIDEADVGRSTFYAHFETKDALLQAICSEIFDHIFQGERCGYPDPSADLHTKLRHILWHIGENPRDVRQLLASQSSDLFLRYLKEYLICLFRFHLEEFPGDVPEDFLLNHLSESFCQTISWWLKHSADTDYRSAADYFFRLLPSP